MVDPNGKIRFKQSSIYSYYVEMVKLVYYNLICSCYLDETSSMGKQAYQISLVILEATIKMRAEWYTNKKILPADLSMNEEILTFWICDDG